ncbi:MAG: (5-formylfuran-3-yl)methyl phosphate synthase [Archaeoglobus sp.]|nr:MAG: (5-formylfuran-3-yl)methyl phosphate synthase [Archaeoglobus sp.]
MLVLVSPKNVKEALEAVKGGADIIDVKNPSEGSLGANFPWVIREVAEAVKPTPVSATIGDMSFKPGTASLAAYSASLWADYVKVGLLVDKNYQALELAKAVVRAVKENGKKAVLAAYADFYRTGTVSPLELPDIGAVCDADVVMIDTAVKDGKSLFEHMDFCSVVDFVDSAHDHGMLCALAGSIKSEDIQAVLDAKADIVGVRGAVCENGRGGRLRRELVEKFVSLAKNFERAF